MKGLAYTYHINGELQIALNIYHKVNFLDSNDAFVNEMIPKCLNDHIEEKDQAYTPPVYNYDNINNASEVA